jgi:parallel beta-helix repeat protein
MAFRALIILIITLLLPAFAAGEVLTSDTFWSKEVLVEEDILVPDGVTLTVLPGTVVRVQPSDSTKTDPEYVSHRTEITIRGNLKVLGRQDAPVVFTLSSTGREGLLHNWAGIIIDSGEAETAWATISGAETALTVNHGTLAAERVTLVENRYGLLIQGEDSSVTLVKSRIERNDYGLLLLNGARLKRSDTDILDNSKMDEFAGGPAPSLPTRSYSLKDRVTSQVYRNEALLGVTVWQGRILVEGVVRVPADAQLIIMPGTIVEFTKRDTNNDGIGENGLRIRGRFIAKGTSTDPIIFRSAEKNPAMGDWDSMNILGSDLSQNLIEFSHIQDAYRGMHFHYSNVAVTNSIMTNNYRGAQFQESLVIMRRNIFHNNRSGIQARDSEVTFEYNEIISNQNGANFFRLDLNANHNIFANNGQDGLRIREGATQIKDNLMIGNRIGLLVADANYSDVQRNFISSNLEGGLALRNSDHFKIKDNAIQYNGINGIVIRESRGTISGNIIAANGVRGIAIESYSGAINRNNIFGNGMYGIGLEGFGDIEARENWWDDSDLTREIYDSRQEPGLGTVNYTPQSKVPIPFSWKWSEMYTDVIWGGRIEVEQKVTFREGSFLKVRPGATVMFGRGAGLLTFGGIDSRGNEDRRITYTSMESEEAEAWDEINLQQAKESFIAYSDFSSATWGMHSHFTSLKVTDSRFKGNYGGIRFRSGPLEISGSDFRENTIGIRSFRGKAVIKGNEITDNEIGIFVRQKGAGLAIHYNNIYANERYAIRLGDFNLQQVDARHNWWGGEDLEKIFFDQKDESYIGPVLFDPILPSRMDNNVR